MTPIEMVAKAIRKEFIDKIIDKANPHWGEQKPDYLLNACKEAGYPEPDKAADFFANAAARAALLALAESELPEDAVEAGAETFEDVKQTSKLLQSDLSKSRGEYLPPHAFGVAPAEMLPETFRAMLRSIASEGGENDAGADA